MQPPSGGFLLFAMLLFSLKIYKLFLNRREIQMNKHKKIALALILLSTALMIFSIYYSIKNIYIICDPKCYNIYNPLEQAIGMGVDISVIICLISAAFFYRKSRNIKA